MVAVPGVADHCLHSLRHRSCLVKGSLGVLGLPGGVRVECLEIHRSPGFPVLLGADDHTMAPGNRSASWNLLDDARFAVSIEAGLDVVTPVDQDIDGCGRRRVWRVGQSSTGVAGPPLD